MATRVCTARAVQIALLLAAFVGVASAATLPSGFTETQIAAGLSNPTAMAFAPDGRLFVCEQDGRVRVVKNGSLLSTPFLTVTVISGGERGLLGIAFDADFASNQFVYLYYTAPSPAVHNRVSRFTAIGDVAVAGSEHVILDLNNLSAATNHNGGAIHFGPDGKLYIAAGENATRPNSQRLTNLLGKILRIDKDGGIPSDNPFVARTSGVNRAIWAMGLRNPFTFAFHPVSGRMFINDVGQSTWEEINEGLAGENYGWPDTEGPTNNPGYRTPVYAYRHGDGPFLGCAIAGGTFYSGLPAQFPAEFVNDYFFADLCGGWINRRDDATGAVTTFASGIAAPVDLAVGPEGGLYYLARGSGRNRGTVVRVDSTTPQPRRVQITLATDPSGLSLLLDGQMVSTPFTFESLPGVLHTLVAGSPQSPDDLLYVFQVWSDDGPQVHTITTPGEDVTITAVYREKKGGRASRLRQRE